MDVKDHSGNAKRGFALIVVLSGLAILTSLFAITSSRAVTHLQTTRSNSILAENTHLSGEIMRWVLKMDPPATADTALLQEQLNGRDTIVQLHDVGGLIDLNTATPELLDLIVSHMGLHADALADFRTWRRTPNRLLRVTDFLRVTSAGPEHRDWLLHVATVHSGRPGIAPDHAPLPVLELITGQSGSRDTLIKSVPDHLVSPASGANFNVMADMANGSGQILIGTVHLTSAPNQNRVLWMP